MNERAPVDIVAMGEAMVEFNQTSQADGRAYLQGFGGDTSNALIAAARQGAKGAYVRRLATTNSGECASGSGARRASIPKAWGSILLRLPVSTSCGMARTDI